MSSVTVISEKERRDISTRLMEMRHGFDESIFGNMHLHIGGGYCVEIFLVKREAGTVLDFISKVRGVLGIREVKYTMTPIEESP